LLSPFWLDEFAVKLTSRSFVSHSASEQQGSNMGIRFKLTSRSRGSHPASEQQHASERWHATGTLQLALSGDQQDKSGQKWE